MRLAPLRSAAEHRRANAALARQLGISREGFLQFAGGAREVEIADASVERLLVLGTFARPDELVDAIGPLVHAAHAYRSALAAGLR